MTRPPARFHWGIVADYLLVVLGAIVGAMNVAFFLAPHNIAPGGVTGLAIIINAFTGWPVGLMILAFNVPLIALGTRYLGGLPFVLRTIAYVTISSLGVDLIARYAPPGGLTEDLLLNAIYAGVVGGLSSGLVYRGGGNVGGTGIISRIVQRLTGLPLSQIYLYVDGVIIVIAALAFGWEAGLYAMIALFVGGLATDYMLEGPSIIRTATIITDQGDDVARAIIAHLGHGVTAWPGEGMYTGNTHQVLFCTINRSQVAELREIMAAVDPAAFVVIGHGHMALGKGFSALRRRFHPPRPDLVVPRRR